MEVNKDEAEKCRNIGAEALKRKDYGRAIKFLKKSLQLYPLPGVEALLSQTERLQQAEENTSSSSNANNSSSNEDNGTSSGSRRSSLNRETSTASSATTGTGADGRAYTEEQVRIVKQILRSKEGGRGAHYRVLGLERTCNESEIKKAYRKLSLKVHPDKNSAPHADEAFKAVGLAYATLSDSQKRTIYDTYGDEDPDSRGGPAARRGGGVHMHGQEVNPEEIFNMFFGGGMGGMGPGVHFYSNGFGPGMHFATGAPRRRRAQRPGEAGGGQQERQSPWAILFQLLPILLMLFGSFFRFGDSGVTGMPGEHRYFSLTYNPPFTNNLATKLSPVKDIPYYVSDKFLRTYYRDRYQLAQVERMVERAYEQYLVDECEQQTRYKKSLEKKATRERDPTEREKKLKNVAEFEATRCVELHDLFPGRRKSHKRYYY